MAWSGIFEFKNNFVDKLGNISMSKVGDCTFVAGVNGRAGAIKISSGINNYLNIAPETFPPPANPTLYGGLNKYSCAVWVHLTKEMTSNRYGISIISGRVPWGTGASSSQMFAISFLSANVWRLSALAYGEAGNSPYYFVYKDFEAEEGWHMVGFSYNGDWRSVNNMRFYFDKSGAVIPDAFEINRYYPDYDQRYGGFVGVNVWGGETASAKEITLSYLNLSEEAEPEDKFLEVYRYLSGGGSCLLSMG
jgi:hypothetical protein